MGHERVGRLPRSQRWSAIVASMAQLSPADPAVGAVAHATLDAVRTRLNHIERDSGVQAAFQFLAGLAQPRGVQRPHGIPDAGGDPTAIRLTTQLHSFVDKNISSPEYGAIAKQAGADAIASWSRRGVAQPVLFDELESASQRWSDAASGAGFSELSRLFFAGFTERYVKYFLDREASAVLATLEARERFANELDEQIEKVSKHAFETARIAQSFAAGWYNKNARGRVPSKSEVRGFLAIAFGKIREELRREAKP